MATTSDLRLSALAGAAGDVVVSTSGDAQIAGLAYDSRSVQQGDLFCCIPGRITDGHLHARAAVESGAVALCVEREVDVQVPTVKVTDSRRALARMAAAYHGHPSRDLCLLGVTGTNGKTTTAFLLDSILRAAGNVTGLIGTIETRVGDERRPGLRTTPDALELQGLFADMRDGGISAAAMEVTSHALALHRVEGVRFTAAAFTNLSQDHLDFHTSMEDYFGAKRELFVAARTDKAAINVDDPYGRRLLASTDVESVSFGLSADADVRAEQVRVGRWSSDFIVRTSDGDMKISTSLVGAFNVSNCLAAAAAALQAGIPPEAIEEGIAALKTVPGRFEPVDAGQPFTLVVDYAHTPDSLDNVLREARRLAHSHDGRVLCVFGAGGNRDAGKRPLMGAVAARLSDVVVVTSDNPRDEEPDAIIGQILEGVMAERAGGADAVLADRRRAIEHVVNLAATGDVVVVAGKGHETGQEIAGRTIPFDDREVARDALRAAGWGGG